MSNMKCSYCDEYAKQGHNYCLMCGYHLTKGYSQYPKVAVEHDTSENYCGFCGKEKDKCSC